MEILVEEQISKAQSGGVDDLPLQEAAERAANMVDYAVRATDNKGEKLPKTSMRKLLWLPQVLGLPQPRRFCRG